MSVQGHQITLVRHGETEWSKAGKHTGRTDIPLTETGEAAARGLADRLAGVAYGAVWTSPSLRARTTCMLAGFGNEAVVKDDLAEWDYGDYEGITTKEIRESRPGWFLFRDGCPNGEAAADVGARADHIIAGLREQNANVLVFSSSHFLRVLAARWIGLPPEGGANFVLDTASISVVGYERDTPVIRRWNQT
ncbi:MAG: histidine phosphatase family protein [Rhizobiaceae bacterium]